MSEFYGYDLVLKSGEDFEIKPVRVYDKRILGSLKN